MSTPTPGYLSAPLKGLEGGPAAFEAPSLIPTLFNVGLSLALVVLLIYAVYWALRRLKAGQALGGDGQPQGLIQVLESRSLDPKRGLAVVEMGGEAYFIGLGEDLTLLSRISDPSAVERLKAQAVPRGGLLGFREQLERIGAQIKREQWKKSKQELRQGSGDLEEQIGRLKRREKP